MSQRWRLTVSRGPAGRDLLHRDVAAAWNTILDALVAAAAPDAPRPRDASDEPPPDERDAGRARVAFAAPVPVGMTSRAELLDVVLPVGRLTRRRLRESVEPLLPAGHTLVSAHDVWAGEPSLPSLVTAADYLVEVRVEGSADGDSGSSSVARAVRALLSEAVIPRPGRDVGRATANLRPLILELRLGESSDDAVNLSMRLLVDQELGSGRPEEVVDALARFSPALTLVAVERTGFVLRPAPAVVARVAKPARRPRHRIERRGV
ncbi:MAG: DUF2344 domain-containing protein [Chloroflexi bacterium]|nr:DUF2344 domain-containing protein [Chloroflexota bacterium]